MSETLTDTHMNPVRPDGDATLSMRGSVAEQMDYIAQRGMTAEGGFAVTDGTEDSSGAYYVTSDISGNLLRQHFNQKGESIAFDAWTERVKIAAGEISLSDSLTDSGGSRELAPGSPIHMAINARGVLGKPNILGTLSADGNSATMVERNGTLFMIRSRANQDGSSQLHAFRIEDGASMGVGRTDATFNFENSEGVHIVRIEADADGGPIELASTPTNQETISGQERTGRLRGIHKAVMGRKSRGGHLESTPSLSDTDINTTIDAMVALESQAEAEVARAAEYKLAEQERIETERKAVSISALSAKYPEAGNIFKPGASLHEDAIWQNLQRHYGIDPAKREDSGRWKELLAHDPKVREYATWVLRNRLDAWCSASPAEQVSTQMGAHIKVEESLGIDRVRAERLQKQYGPDSLISGAATDRKLISNTLVPDRIRLNKNKSPDSYALHNLPKNLRSRDHVVGIALAMLDGSFDYGQEERIYGSETLTNDERNVRIYKIHAAQHRTAAGMIIDGQV